MQEFILEVNEATIFGKKFYVPLNLLATCICQAFNLNALTEKHKYILETGGLKFNIVDRVNSLKGKKRANRPQNLP
jgi:hypothetical protein